MPIIPVLIFLLVYQNCCCQQRLPLYFPSASHQLAKRDKLSIDSLLRADSVLSVRIEAHCDSVGSLDYNDELAMKRAQEVKFYLLQKGIGLDKISIRSVGEREFGTQELAANRRVDLVAAVKEEPAKKISPVAPTAKANLASAGEGETIRLENIQFQGNRHLILPESEKALNELYTVLKDHPKLEIEIQGHICCQARGDALDLDTFTPDLSVQRARAVHDFLVSKGIAASRLTYKGMGANFPQVKELTAADEALNRRVEVKVVRK